MPISEKELRLKLERFVKGKSQHNVCKDIGISQAYLNGILRGKRRIDNPKILKKFGYKKVIKLVEK